MRGRGLKHEEECRIIERSQSPAMRGRGLKLVAFNKSIASELVARHARAWIETNTYLKKALATPVARHARAWIETFIGDALPYVV